MVIGIDIGGTKTRIGRSDHSPTPEKTISFATPLNYNEAIEALHRGITQICAGELPSSIGIVVPSAVDAKNGIILHHKNIHWIHAQICKDLANYFNCPISLGHDATSAGVAEARFGAGRDYHAVLYVTISTGIGIGYIIGGNPIESKFALEGGEMLITTDPQTHQMLSFEQVASGKAIAARYGKIAAEIYDKKAWSDIGSWIGVGLYNFICILQPDVVILGGGVSVHFDRFVGPMMKYLKNTQPSNLLPPIVQARFIETAPLVGALQLARKNSY